MVEGAILEKHGPVDRLAVNRHVASHVVVIV
jgi:hypothetical protein